MEECHKMLTDQIDWANLEGDQVRIDIKKPLPLSSPPGHDARYHDFRLELLIPEHMWIDDVCTYDISASYGISHWWFNRQKFYIDRHTAESSRKDFKNLYPSDFEDLNLLLLQGHLNHLPGSDIRMLSTAVKLWTRNLVIRQRVEDFQLGIESYQKQLNLTKPGWDATGFEFKHDYTIIDSPRAVVFPVSNNEWKIMRFNEIYKFSDAGNSYMSLNGDSRPEGSSGIWNALLVDGFAILTTDFFKERNDLFIPFISQNRRDLPRDNPLVSVEVLRYDIKRSKCENKGIVLTEMELELEQTQQGSSHEVSSRAKRSSINLIRTLFHITCSSHNVKTRIIIRFLRIILVVLPEHPSDTYVFTMKMEILLEPTSSKLIVGDSDVHILEDPTLILEILSRRFFLRLNLPDHRPILTGSGVKMEMEIPCSSGVYFITACSDSTNTSNDLMKAQSRMSNTSDKGTTFGDGAARVGMQLRSSPKVSTSSPLVSPSTIINVPRELYSIDVAATFGVPLTTVGDLQKLINDIDAGKHDELLSELTNEDRMETLEALGSICNSIKVDRNNADVIPCKVSYADDSINLNVDESTIPSDPIVQSVDIKSTSMLELRGGSARTQPANVNSNFVKLRDGSYSVFEVDGVDYARRNIRVEYEWRPPRCDICKIFGHVHDLIALKSGEYPLLLLLLMLLPLSEKDYDGFKWWVKRSRGGKGKSKFTNGRRLGNSSKKDNLSMSNSFSALNEEEEDDEEEEVENVYDESANLIQNTKAGGSSSFTAAAEASLPKLGSSTEPKVCNAGPQPALLDSYGYSTFDEFPAGTDEETSNNETTYKNKSVGNIGKNILFFMKIPLKNDLQMPSSKDVG
ncbi:hypothetical protein Tco_0690779 [Tanacetum coccineum]